MTDHNATLLRLRFELPDEAATLALGGALGQVFAPENALDDCLGGAVVFLDGNLGAGKTTLVRGLLRGLGYVGRVKSPTYTLVEPHEVSGLNFYHFDFYRFTHPEEYLEAGLDEYFSGTGICLVEWPDKAQPYLPAVDVSLCLEVVGAGRSATLNAYSPKGVACLNALNKITQPL